MATAEQKMARRNLIWAFTGYRLGQHLCKFYTSTQRIAGDSVKRMYMLCM